MTVLTLGDFPVGVYTTRAKAEVAADTDWKRREPTWNQEPKLKIGECRGIITLPPYMKYYYSFYDFVVNSEAQL